LRNCEYENKGIIAAKYKRIGPMREFVGVSSRKLSQKSSKLITKARKVKDRIDLSL